jgi:26S proteasome regulatory subunit N3
MPDVDMKAENAKAEAKKEEQEKPVPTPLTPVAEIKANATLIERAVSTLEPRFTLRVLRSLASLRKRLDNKVLRDAVTEIYPKGAPRVHSFIDPH